MAEQAYLLNQLKNLTMNCQGLKDKSKCRDVFNNLKQKNHNVHFLQDTHFTPNEENQILYGVIRRTLTHMHPTQEAVSYTHLTLPTICSV